MARQKGVAGLGRDRNLRILIVTFSVVAGGLHALATPSHFQQWWGYGTFFAIVGGLQIGYGWVWLRRAETAHILPLVSIGVSLNLALLGLYIVTRTLGIPLVGPEAGHVEPAGLLDLLSKGTELLLTLSLVAILWRRGGAMPLSAISRGTSPSARGGAA